LFKPAGVWVRRPQPVALLLRLTKAQFHGTALRRKQRWAHPAIVGLFRQQMPAQHGELASKGDSGDLLSALGAKPHE